MLLTGWNFKNKSVLDIGCGRGEALKYANDKGATHLVGTDFSESAIQYCKNLYDKEGNIFFMLMEAKDTLVFNVYHYVFMLDVIEHIPNEEMQIIYPKIFKALKPSGIFIIKTPFYQSQESYENTWVLSDDDKEVHINIQSKKRLLNDLEKVGFYKLSSHYYQKSPILFTSMLHAYRYELRIKISNWKRRIMHPLRSLHFLKLKIGWWIKSIKK